MDNTKNAEEVWDKAKDLIKEKVNPQTFETWFKPTKGAGISGSTLALEVPNSFFKDWLLEHHLDVIKAALNSASGRTLIIDFTYLQAEPEKSAEQKPRPQAKSSEKKQGVQNNLGLNPAYTFDDFVVGPSNKMAHAAALAVAESPAKAYNPLFKYGKAGMGKTHLMNAIGHCVAAKNQNMKVVYITSEQFTNQLIQAIQNRSTDKFRMKYRGVDVLLIDDVHFIAGKESTQEEIDGLEERLVSRFEWGLIVSISQPDFETRVAILRQKLKRENIDVPDDVIFYIGEKIKSNIRELEGALKRVVANAVLLKQSVTTDLARSVLKDMVKEKESRITAESIFEEVAAYFNVRVSDIKGRRRTKQMVMPRQLSMYLIRKLTDHSLPEIGELCGGRDHTTVMHACESVESDLKKDQKVKEIVGKLTALIGV